MSYPYGGPGGYGQPPQPGFGGQPGFPPQQPGYPQQGGFGQVAMPTVESASAAAYGSSPGGMGGYPGGQPGQIGFDSVGPTGGYGPPQPAYGGPPQPAVPSGYAPQQPQYQMLDYSWKLYQRRRSRSPINRDNKKRKSPSPSWRSGRSDRPRSPMRKDRRHNDNKLERQRSPRRTSPTLRLDRREHRRSPLRIERGLPSPPLREGRSEHRRSPPRKDERFPSPTWRDERLEYRRSPLRRDERFPSPTWRDGQSEHQRSPPRRDERFPSPTWRDGMLQRHQSLSPLGRNERLPSPSLRDEVLQRQFPLSDSRRDDERRGAILRSDRDDEQDNFMTNINRNQRDRRDPRRQESNRNKGLEDVPRDMYRDSRERTEYNPGRRGTDHRSDRVDDRDDISSDIYRDSRDKIDDISGRRGAVLRSDDQGMDIYNEPRDRRNNIVGRNRSDRMEDQADNFRDNYRDSRDIFEDIPGRRGAASRSDRVEDRDDISRDIYRDSMERIEDFPGNRGAVLKSDRVEDQNDQRDIYKNSRDIIVDIPAGRRVSIIEDQVDIQRNMNMDPGGGTDDVSGRGAAIVIENDGRMGEMSRNIQAHPKGRINEIRGRTGAILRSDRNEEQEDILQDNQPKDTRNRKRPRPNARIRRAMRLRGQMTDSKNSNEKLTDTSQPRRRSSGENDLRLVIEAHKKKNQTSSDLHMQHNDNISQRNARELHEQDMGFEHEHRRRYDEGEREPFIREIAIPNNRSHDHERNCPVPNLQISFQDGLDTYKRNESDTYPMDHRGKDPFPFQNEREQFRGDFRPHEMNDRRFGDSRFDSPLRDHREFDEREQFRGDFRPHEINDRRFADSRFDSPLRDNREFDDIPRNRREHVHTEPDLRLPGGHDDYWHQIRFDPYFESDPRRYSSDFEGSLPREPFLGDYNRSELQECKMAGCLVRTDNIKLHTLRKHVPEVVWSVEESAEQSQRDLSPQRASLLKAQAMAILGPQGTIPQLVDLVNGIGVPIPDEEQLTASHWAMVELCHHQKWAVPDSFSLNPINSPAVLIHWRVQSIIMGLLPEERAKNFLSVYRYADPSKSSVARNILEAVPRNPDRF